MKGFKTFIGKTANTCTQINGVVGTIVGVVTLIGWGVEGGVYIAGRIKAHRQRLKLRKTKSIQRNLKSNSIEKTS